MLVPQKSTAEQAAVPASCRDAMDIGENAVRAEFWGQDLVYEAFLGLTLSENVKADQCDGLPPSTFFSHSSDSV